MSVCMNCGTHSAEDMDVISHLIKIRLKPKVLLNHYMLCVRCGWRGTRPGAGAVGCPGPAGAPRARLVCRELLNAHRDNLGTTIKFVIFNELSNARNPNNMQVLYTVLQHSSELAPKVGSPGGRAAATAVRGWEGSAWGARPGARLQGCMLAWAQCPLCGKVLLEDRAQGAASSISRHLCSPPGSGL